MEQGSEEWIQARLGKVTASRISDVCAQIKSGGYGESRANYMAELVSERMTGEEYPSFISKEMQWGIDHQQEAIDAYCWEEGCTVERVGFVPHPAILMAGASPDGLVGKDGLVEFKCPTTKTHLKYLLDRKIPTEYRQQMQFQMACRKRKWCDWVSYDPRLPKELHMLIIREKRDDIMIAKIEREVVLFLGHLEDQIAQFTKLYKARPKIAA